MPYIPYSRDIKRDSRQYRIANENKARPELQGLDELVMLYVSRGSNLADSRDWANKWLLGNISIKLLTQFDKEPKYIWKDNNWNAVASNN